MKKQSEHWHPPVYTERATRAIQALADGDASPQMQQDALQWIIDKACSVYDEPFRPGSPDTVAYMLGRRSVGLAIIKLMKLSLAVFEAENSRQNNDDRGRRQDRRDSRRYDDDGGNNRRHRPRDDEDFREG